MAIDHDIRAGVGLGFGIGFGEAARRAGGRCEGAGGGVMATLPLVIVGAGGGFAPTLRRALSRMHHEIE